LLESSEGSRYVRLVVDVDEHSAGFDAIGETEGLSNVLGKDTTGQAVLRSIGPLHQGIHVAAVELGDYHDGTE